jgi:uncharacterized protein YjdB
VNQTVQMNAMGFFSDGTSKDLTGSAKWTSSDPKAISVSGSGLVTAVQVGSATVTASVGSVQGSTTATSSRPTPTPTPTPIPIG